ncbi:DNA polymerase III subunit delta [Herbivorax sp. ANBcel31]|uniref:DNA polymerase III subunit delta n=1 Tax=Herbivorax sp. ANBcel31 TaxID=3069754 RepID=UPI0027B2B9DA|nr:DNA polymerase III subunit delta [Herbivorax sp. ANBcel31]MDQ2085940.1 DNA polymerase III subunit delta [Herbivorax sp. ANBcel31]
MSVKMLKEEIKKNNLKNLYIFYGEEEYLKKYYIEKIEDIILKDDVTNLNKIVLDGNAEVDKIIEACETMPVFSQQKLVVVKKSGKFNKKGGSKSKSSENDQLSKYLENVPPYTCLIFYEESIDKRLKIVGSIKKNGLLVEFSYSKQPDLVKWVIKVLKSYKKRIDLNTASYLVSISEPGMVEILNEIEKLVSFLGEKENVEIKDIDKVCTKSIKSRIFDLVDAVAEKKINIALKLLNDMIMLKEPLPKILFMIARQLRLILQMKLLCNDGLDKKAACSKMKITPYVGNKIYSQARSLSTDKVKDGMKEAMELDLAIKTGKINDRIATEILIYKLAE